MPPATFDVQPGLAADAFQYVCNCFEWLAAGSGMLESQRSIVQELDLEKFAQRAERLLWTIRCVQNRSAPVNRLPPELLGVIFEHLMDLQVPAHPSNELMEYQWPVVQSVCRYWRDTAVHTPLLWSYVRIRNPHAKQAQPGLASTILTRSGVVPLTIHIRSQGLNDVVREPCDEHLRDQLKANSWRIYELHTEFAEPIVLDSCLQDASQLERMIINDDTGCLKSSVYGHWRIPKLRTLVAINFTGWRDRGGFRTLRHLILENQPFNAPLLRGLHSLLTLNPLLEDLVAKDIWGSLELETTLDALPSVNMPGLRRTFVQCGGFSAIDALVSKKLELQEGHARVYQYPVFAQHFDLLQQKLFITADALKGCIVGTDGRSGFCLEALLHVFRDQCAALSRQHRVQELWLWTGGHFMHAPNGDPFDWIAWFKEMKEIKKIVLVREIHGWLDYISQHHLFPALTEVQLQDPQECDKSAVLQFLKQRAQSHAIQTLRFAQDFCGIGGSNAYLSWKENISMFTQYVPLVVFEDQQPLRMELPAVCTTSSTAHGYWPSWEERMYLGHESFKAPVCSWG